MKKIILSVLVVGGFAIAALVMPSFEVKIAEKVAAACDNPSCGN